MTKDDLLYFVYGLLHSQDYRTEFAADLKKMLPRIPKLVDPAGFTVVHLNSPPAIQSQ